MADELELVTLKVQRGPGQPMLIETIQGVLDQIAVELEDPNSKTSMTAAELGLTVANPVARVGSGVVGTTAFLIGLGYAFGKGAAGEAGKDSYKALKAFYARVIKPRLRTEQADGVGDAEVLPSEKDGDDGQSQP
jgi:hypothetical protein